ncbi:MAG: HAD family hydrolase [Candidatus Microsaccharimonas sp.]
MKRFEGFVFDIDNTAVPEESLVVTSKPLLQAFHALDSHIPAIAATGRTVEFALPITSQLALHHESVVANGAQIINSRSGEVLIENSLNQDQVKRIIALCEHYDSTAHLAIAGDPTDSFFTAREQQARSAPGVFFMNLTEEIALAVEKELLENEQVGAYVSHSTLNGEHMYDVNIGNKDAEKGTALRKLLAIKAIDPMKMIGVGDSVNDISLFEAVGYRIATADADPTLLSMADEIIPPESEDGLLSVVRRFI